VSVLLGGYAGRNGGVERRRAGTEAKKQARKHDLGCLSLALLVRVGGYRYLPLVAPPRGVELKEQSSAG
jgi:hypothetical protein